METERPHTIELIRLITESEHHFNNLCFKIRTLASTWLLATFAAVGFVLTKQGDFILQRPTIVILVCWAAAIGIFVLWILDLQVYQTLLNVWFDSRKEIEEESSYLPQIRQRMKVAMPGGRASNLIKIYYITMVAAPLSFALILALKFLNVEQPTTICPFLITLLLLLGEVILIILIKISVEPRFQCLLNKPAGHRKHKNVICVFNQKMILENLGFCDGKIHLSLNQAQMHHSFQKMSGIGMPQCLRGDAFL